MSTSKAFTGPEALPVIPQTTDEMTPYMEEYEDALGQFDLDERTAKAALTVVRLCVDHRRSMARDERDRNAQNSGLYKEYAELFIDLDHDADTTVEERMVAFGKAKLLPSYELFARLALGDKTGALSTDLAQKAFKLLASATQGTAIQIGDKPEAHIKVTDLLPSEHPYDFAVVSTKVDGLALQQGGHMLQVKTRRDGLIDLKDLTQADSLLMDALKALARVGTMPASQREIFRDRVEKYLKDGGTYLPVIDRGYLTRTDLTKLVAEAQAESDQLGA